MKKIFCIMLVNALILSVCILSACGKTETPRLGVGVYSSASATDATEDKDGQGTSTVTVAAVLVNKYGKIESAFIDSVENKVSYTVDGRGNTTDTVKTKYEQGDAYNMVEYGGATKEWYAQADTFCALIEGKTIDEVKALVGSDGKGNDEVINAGCTIVITEFVYAVEEAVNNATSKLGIQ